MTQRWHQRYFTFNEPCLTYRFPKKQRIQIKDPQRPVFWHTANGNEMCSSLTKRLFKLIKTIEEQELGHFYTQLYPNVNCWNNIDSNHEKP